MEATNAIVTGGSRGVGRTITEALVELGYTVYTCARGEAALGDVARAMPRVHVERVDVTDREATRRWIDGVLKSADPVDVLVNNAGVMSAVGPLVDLDLDEWERVFDRNLFSVARICQQVLPSMIARRQGCVINLAGGGSAYPRKSFTAYACSKAAVVRLSDTLADEVREFNVRVNALAPGLQESAIWRHAVQAGEAAPARHWDDPEDLKRLVKFLVTTPAVTGKFLHIKDAYATMDAATLAGELFTLRRINP